STLFPNTTLFRSLVGLLVDALEGEEARLLRALPLPQELDDRVRAARDEVCFAAPRRPAAPDSTLRVDARADDRRVAEPAGHLEEESRSRRHAHELAPRAPH